VSFHWRRHSAENKAANFRPKATLGPRAHVSIAPAICAFCPMRSVTRCDIPSCNLPLCEKHRTKKSGGSLCDKHKVAVLVQYDGMPTERFGDKGEAYPQKIRSV